MKSSIVLFLLVLICQFGVAQKQTLQGTNLQFELPNDKWFLADTQQVGRRSVITYKREPIENKDGLKIIPNIAFTVEEVPDSTDIMTFSIHYRSNVPNVTEVFTHDSKKTKLNYKNGLGYKGSYTDEQGMDHSIYMLHLINGKKGIRVILDITSDIAENYDAEFVKTMRSIKEI